MPELPSPDSDSASPSIPHPVIRRLPKYLIHVQELRDEGVVWASSQQIADALGLTSSTVRQDLSHLDLSGISKRGYEAEQLEVVLRQVLGADIVHRVVIVGAGNLGRSLAEHGAFAQRGFEICGIFDRDPALQGRRVAGMHVQPIERFCEIVRAQPVDIGLIAVPSAAAQGVADLMIDCGIRAILNLAYKHIQVPEGVHLVDARIIESLQELAYALGKNRVR